MSLYVAGVMTGFFMALLMFIGANSTDREPYGFSRNRH